MNVKSVTVGRFLLCLQGMSSTFGDSGACPRGRKIPKSSIIVSSKPRASSPATKTRSDSRNHSERSRRISPRRKKAGGRPRQRSHERIPLNRGLLCLGSPDMESVGQSLQKWLIRNKMNIYHHLFVDAVDHAFENEARRLTLSQNSRPTISPATTDSSLDPGSPAARTTA